MPRSYRKERLSERIKELIGEIVLSQTKDPRIGMVTITSVTLAPDYTTAKVYFTVMGDDVARDATRKGLESAKSFLRKTVARELKLRQAPELRFVYDESLDRAMRIEETIGKMRREGPDEGSGDETDDQVGDENETSAEGREDEAGK